MNIEYCHKCCAIGKKKSKEVLNKNESACAAAVEFMLFAEDCFKNCKNKDYQDTCNNKANK